MPGLSDAQLLAVLEAQKLLDSVGLSVDSPCDDPRFIRVSETLLQSFPSLPSAPIQCSQYDPPAARIFTASEILSGANKVTRQSSAVSLIDHPLGAMVEYPQTGSAFSEGVAHRFVVDPNTFTHPKDNIQYSKGDTHGAHRNFKCHLLRDASDEPVLCHQLKTSCEFFVQSIQLEVLTYSFPGKGLKICSSYSSPDDHHFFTSRATLSRLQRSPIPAHTTHEEVFRKTLAFYCVLLDQGCSFDHDAFGHTSVGTGHSDVSSSESDDEGVPSISSRRQVHLHDCKGQIILRHDSFMRPFIQ